MGSKSDWETMKLAVDVLDDSASRTNAASCRRIARRTAWPNMPRPRKSADSKCIIAGAGGAAHLPGMVAAQTLLPVLGVPVQSKALNGLDSLLSIVQMPGGVPVGTLAIGEAGATNAGLLAVAILANERPALREKLRRFAPSSRQKVRRGDAADEARRAILPGGTDRRARRRPARSDVRDRGAPHGLSRPRFSPDRDTPTGQVADVEITRAYDDLDELRRFARRVEVVTFEFENVTRRQRSRHR